MMKYSIKTLLDDPQVSLVQQSTNLPSPALQYFVVLRGVYNDTHEQAIIIADNSEQKKLCDENIFVVSQFE